MNITTYAYKDYQKHIFIRWNSHRQGHYWTENIQRYFQLERVITDLTFTTFINMIRSYFVFAVLAYKIKCINKWNTPKGCRAIMLTMKKGYKFLDEQEMYRQSRYKGLTELYRLSTIICIKVFITCNSNKNKHRSTIKPKE